MTGSDGLSRTILAKSLGNSQNTSYLSNCQAMRCKRRQTLVTPEPGRYQHFKGGLYEVLGVARHSETEEELVVYRPLYGAGALWARPRRMFQEHVLVDGARSEEHTSELQSRQ